MSRSDGCAHAGLSRGSCERPTQLLTGCGILRRKALPSRQPGLPRISQCYCYLGHLSPTQQPRHWQEKSSLLHSNLHAGGTAATVSGTAKDGPQHDSVLPTASYFFVSLLGRRTSAIMRLLSAVAPLGRFIPQVEAPSGGKRVQFK